MAEANFTIGFDDESKELIKALVKAVDRIAPAEPSDLSFADVWSKEPQPKVLKRLIEPGSVPLGEGEWAIPNADHTGEDTE